MVDEYTRHLERNKEVKGKGLSQFRMKVLADVLLFFSPFSVAVLPHIVGKPSRENMFALSVCVIGEAISWASIPIFAWLLWGFEWTGNAWLYGLRLLVLALVCEVPYDCDVRQRVRHALAEPRVRPRGRADRARHTRPHVRMAHECAQGGAFGRCDHHRPAVGFHAVGRADATPHERRHCDARHVRDLLLPAFPREHDGVHGRHIRRGLRIDALLGCGGAHYRNDKLGYTHRWTRWAFYPVYPIMLVLCAAIGMAN